MPAGGAAVGLCVEAPLEAGEADVVLALGGHRLEHQVLGEGGQGGHEGDGGERDGRRPDHADDASKGFLHKVGQLLPVGSLLLCHLKEEEEEEEEEVAEEEVEAPPAPTCLHSWCPP